MQKIETFLKVKNRDPSKYTMRADVRARALMRRKSIAITNNVNEDAISGGSY